MSDSPWGHKESDMTDRPSFTHSMIASAFRTKSDLENVLEQSSTWGDFTPQGTFGVSENVFGCHSFGLLLASREQRLRMHLTILLI